MSGPVVALAMPRGTPAVRSRAAATAFYRASARRDVTRLEMDKTETSLAIRCFNLLWAQALDARAEYGITHFCMQHDDVCPEPGFLDVLLDQLEATGADMLSAVIPIKNPTGCTSTAVSMGDPWTLRRLTMHEVFQLPEVFGLDDIPWRRPDSQLLLNSGLWVCRFTDDWVERVCFRDQARIIRKPDGKFQAQDISEDWDWSYQLQALGLKLRATRLPLYHERPEFTTRQPWGAWQTDEAYTLSRAIAGPAIHFPADVEGWLTEEEGRALARLAEGKDVLEIGSYCGRSTICLAQTAASVHAVDPFDGRATSEPQATLEKLLGSLSRYGVLGKVTTYPAPSADVVPCIDRQFDLVFIDGDHRRASVLQDARMATEKLKPGGLLVFHDYRKFDGEMDDGHFDPGVTAAVNELLGDGAELLERVGSVAVVRPAACPALA